MIEDKIFLRDEERQFILNERKRTNYSAEYVSEKIGRSKSWLAQLENGRTKTIRRKDFIDLLCFLRNDNDRNKIEGFIQASLAAIAIKAPLPESPNSEKIKPFIDNNDYSIAGLNQSLHDWNTAITHFMGQLYKQYPDKKQFMDVLYNILYNLYSNPSLSLSVMSASLNRLSNVDRKTQTKFCNEFFELIDKYGADDNFDLFLRQSLK